MYQRPPTLGVTPPSPALTQYYQMTGFLQQQPAGVATQLQTVSPTIGGVQELPLDMKAIQDHMAVQALVRSYQVCISPIIFITLLNIRRINKNVLTKIIIYYRCVVTK
jgi:hypothetical protein